MKVVMQSLLTLAMAGLVSGTTTCAEPPQPDKGGRPLILTAIPDQSPEQMQQLYNQVADYLTQKLGAPVKYQPSKDYESAVGAFKKGEADLVWFGGLTGVMAANQVRDAHYIAQRDIDRDFHSVFIARKGSDIKSLKDLKGKTFTFGSPMSTSGRLMPQHYLREAGITFEAFKDKPNFSGDHDKTLRLVAEGTYDAGAMNEQVWKNRQKAGVEATEKVQVFYTTPAFVDYHWLLHPDAARRHGGDGFVQKMREAFLRLDQDPKQAAILEMFGAGKFIPTSRENYKDTERIARELKLID